MEAWQSIPVHRRCGIISAHRVLPAYFCFLSSAASVCAEGLLHIALLPAVAIAERFAWLATNQPWWVEVIQHRLLQADYREPDSDQIEVAIRALQVVVDRDQLSWQPSESSVPACISLDERGSAIYCFRLPKVQDGQLHGCRYSSAQLFKWLCGKGRSYTGLLFASLWRVRSFPCWINWQV